MKRTGRGVLAGLALAAALATQASATSWAGNGSPYCGGNTFSTCIGIDLSWVASNGSNVVVTLKLTNLSNAPGLKWFSVGLDNLNMNGLATGTCGSLAPAAGDFAYCGVGPDVGWHNPPPNDLTGGPFDPEIASSVFNGGQAPGTSQRTWTFTFKAGTALGGGAAGWDDIFNNGGVGLHAGGVTLNGVSCSTKLEVIKTGGVYGTNGPDGSSTACVGTPDIPQEVIPEPMTMSLMAMGLVGLAGAGAIRRRRNRV